MIVCPKGNQIFSVQTYNNRKSLEFALQHIGKSVERYEFLIFLMCAHCGLFYYLSV